MRLPTWDELQSVPEQRDVLEYPLDRSLFVAGPPGSGKTVLAVQRAEMAATLVADDAGPSVAIVTYNRMLRRLVDILGEGGLRARTMHSFVSGDYQSRSDSPVPTDPSDTYAYDWDTISSRLEEAGEHPNRPHLVVDEGQDLPREFFEYASRYVSRTITVFADDDQALGERRTTLEQIKAAAGLENPIILSQNHRNTPEIARLAEHFHSGRLPAATVVRSSLRELPRLVRTSGLDSIAGLIANWCSNRGGSIGVIVNRNETGSDLHGNLRRRLPQRRVDIYRHKDKNEDSIEMLEPGVTILNKESVKGQEFDTVFILELEEFIPCANDVERRAMYMMCTRARDQLFLVHDGPLSAGARAALPDARVLERTSPEGQIAMPLLPTDEQVPEARWLGLATDHRRLFDALQDGWLRPVEPQAGVLVGVGRYLAERIPDRQGHPIPVYIELDAEKLPGLSAHAFRGGRWKRCSIREVESSDTALYWPGALPVFAIREITVSAKEEHARLAGMAKSASNLVLPEEIRVGRVPEVTSGPEGQPSEVTSPLPISGDEDAVRGAMAMAVWAAPGIDPWLDLLTTALASDRSRLPSLASNVDASWWRFPPWAPPLDDTEPLDLQDRLWRAAVLALRTSTTEGRIAPRELAERIARDSSSRCERSTDRDRIRAWLASTNMILCAESTIRLDGWRSCPVGIAIQLVLTRPDPVRFKTWFQDLPGLPPAVAWSAAALCGLLHGYRGLDAHFRGGAFQRELLSILALRACTDAAREVDWPSLSSGEPSWRRESGNFVLSWGAREFARRPEKARGRWYAANFEDEATRRKALEAATGLDWQCTYRGEFVLRDVQTPLRGSSKVRVMDESAPRFEVEGEVRLRVPKETTIEEIFDADSFRRLVAVEGIERGRLPNPPTLPAPGPKAEEMVVPGLRYVPDFLSENEEAELVATIDRGVWGSELKRRVQHHGWRYDYKARELDRSMHLGPLPDWADQLARRLEAEGLVPQRPDQVIVNEYVGDQGISAHVDSPSFADGIATISLLESWEMVFREKSSRRKVPQVLERRSVAIMGGDARDRWTHEIPHRKTEPGSSGKVKRGRRISLTFRKVKGSDPPDGKGEPGHPT